MRRKEPVTSLLRAIACPATRFHGSSSVKQALSIPKGTQSYTQQFAFSPFPTVDGLIRLKTLVERHRAPGLLQAEKPRNPIKTYCTADNCTVKPQLFYPE